MQADLARNYFELFGLPVGFAVDSKDLAARYRTLQRNFHPDKFAHASDQERRLSMQLSARLNEGLQTLKDPVKRGRYLLQLKNIATDEETDTAMDREFLVEQMALRERLEEARDLASLVRVRADIDARFGEKVCQLEARLRSAATEDWQAARGLVRELQFLQKLLQEVRAHEEALG